MVKVNMGLASSKQDIKDLIKDIFILQSRPEGNSVYILEEMHALRNEQDQVPLLEEFMHVPEGVYIIMCTTKKYKLIPELRGRATEFALSRPSEDECLALVEDICLELKIGAPSKQTMKWLVRKCKNTPREIVKVVDLLSKGGSIDEDVAKRYLGEIDASLYSDYFRVCFAKDFSLSKLVDFIDNLKVDYVDYVRGFRQYILDTAICIWGSNADSLGTKSKKELYEVFKGFDEERFLDLVQLVKDFNKVKDSNDAQFELFSLCQNMRGRTIQQAIRQSTKLATESKIKGERIVTQKHQEKIVNDSSELSDESIMELLGAVTEYEEG